MIENAENPTATIDNIPWAAIVKENVAENSSIMLEVRKMNKFSFPI